MVASQFTTDTRLYSLFTNLLLLTDPLASLVFWTKSVFGSFIFDGYQALGSA